MNWTPSFTRKIIYICLLVALIFPIAILGIPASRDADGRTQPGGVLSQARLDQGLAQAKLGEIDPASETMRLATFGMQGVATVFLWDGAMKYKEKADWDKLQAVLNQLVKLQPNFIEVWKHQGWNIAYNVSVEFDDYRYRYHWVKKGLDILIEGTHYNRNEPKLLDYIGWVYGHKFGRSDEHVQFRKLFRDDTDYHRFIADEGIDMDKTIGAQGKPDNWLVSHEWYQVSHKAVNDGKPVRGTSHLLFYSNPGMQLINYADSIEEEGILGGKAKEAWGRASNEWARYGNKVIPTSWGVDIYLSELDRGMTGGKGLRGEVELMKARLEKLTPGVRERLLAERRKTLTKDEVRALDTPAEKRAQADYPLVSAAEEKMLLTHKHVADAAPAAAQEEVQAVAFQLGEMEKKVGYIESYRQIVNFEYWRTRCEIEQTAEALDGRNLLRQADKAFLEDTDFELARKLYEQAFDNWAKIYEREAQLTDKKALLDDETSDTIYEAAEHYRDVLVQLNKPFPKDFKLNNLLEAKQAKWHLVGGEEKKGTEKKGPPPTPEKKPADPPAAEKKPDAGAK